ncbi:MAG: precorrin-2 C(20)-methyltransferase [Methanobacteriaceae archaeon]
MKKGKLIGIGVGPGDSELLTLKAINVLKDINVICAPKSSENKESIALSIIKPILKDYRKDGCEAENYECIEGINNNSAFKENYSNLKVLEPLFPMIEDEKELEFHWDNASKQIASYLDKGEDVAFITLGDPSIFSTFSYILKRLRNSYLFEIIPGITSFTACAASIGKPLVEKDDILVIVPKVDERLENIIKIGNSFVIMKGSRHSSELEEIINLNPNESEITSVKNCSMENEKVKKGFFKSKPYLTTTIVKFKDKKINKI